jgi:uncharacterized membrane protein
MSKREILAWAAFVLSLAAVAWLGWQLFGRWPDTAWFEAHQEALALPMDCGFFAIIAISVAMARWRPQEPLDDERDLRIRGEGARHGFIALIVLNMVAGILLLRFPPQELQMGPQWMRYCLMWMVLVAVAVDAGVQLHRYRRG